MKEVTILNAFSKLSLEIKNNEYVYFGILNNDTLKIVKTSNPDNASLMYFSKTYRYFPKRFIAHL